MNFNLPWNKVFEPSFDQQKVGSLGEKFKMSCGGDWIVGKDFAFGLDFSASSYYSLSNVHEIREDSMPTAEWRDQYHHIMLRLLQDPTIKHTTKTRNEVAEELGIKEYEKTAKSHI